MKASKGLVIAALVSIAAVGGFAAAGLLKQTAKPETATEVQTEVQTEAQIEAETPPEATEALEYVTDENWDTMVRVYRIIMDNFSTAKELVSNGQADPDDVVQRANDIIEYGKACEKDNLLNQEAEEVLRKMVDVADSMLTLIEDGGGEIIEIPSADETTAGSAHEVEEPGDIERSEDVEEPGDGTEAESQETAHKAGDADAVGADGTKTGAETED